MTHSYKQYTIDIDDVPAEFHNRSTRHRLSVTASAHGVYGLCACNEWDKFSINPVTIATAWWIHWDETGR